VSEKREDWAELEVDGVVVDAWTSYSVSSDLFTPSDPCRLSIGIGTTNQRELKANLDKLRETFKPGKTAKLWITSSGKRSLQGVFAIDRWEVSNDGDGGTQFGVTLRDQASKLVDSAADPKLYTSGDSLVSVARKAVAQWPEIQVTADHVAARDLRQARVTKDKLARLQKKARANGIAPRLMSEKIAASIDKGTITFDDFLQAAAGGIYTEKAYKTFDVVSGQRITVDEKTTVREFQKAGATLAYGGYYLGVPYSGAAGLSSLKIYQLKVQDIRPQSGETVWEFLDRSAKRNGLLMSFTPDGKLLFCGLHYDQAPSYRIIRRINDGSQNNVVSGSVSLDISNVYSDVIVYGRAKGKDKARSKFKGHAVTAANEPSYVPFPKTLVVRDNSIRSQEDAQRRAEYELARSKQGALVLSYQLMGHSQNGLVFSTDTVAEVDDEVTGIRGCFYVTARDLTRSNNQGPRTSLNLVPLGSIALSKDGDLA
jgi:prophage tail gpP-like protein